jgi:ribosome biogenesis GTPase / thiamine phosphate phosphatase
VPVFLTVCKILTVHLVHLQQPPFEPPNATRFLVSAEAAGIPVTLVLNKADLLPPAELEQLVDQVTTPWQDCLQDRTLA